MNQGDSEKTNKQLLQHKFREAKFFLGQMEVANLELFSRNIQSTAESEFEYYLSAFSGALYPIDVYLRKMDDVVSLKEWEEKARESSGEEQMMYDVFLGESGIRHESVHIERVIREDQATTKTDIITKRTISVSDQHGCNFVFPEEKSGNGILKPPIADYYREEYSSGGRVHVPVVVFSDDYLYDVVHSCLKEQSLM